MSISKNKFIGDRAFYKKVLAISVPMMIQNGVANLASLLDNVMVGSVGTEAMSGVSIVNQFVFIFYLSVFGAISAAGIFTAQYHGLGDETGVRNTFRFKLIINLAVGAVAVALFFFCSDALIGSFLHDSASEGDLELTLAYGREYLMIMLWGMIPYSLAQAYASTMRETGDAKVPMIAATGGVLVNLVLNTVLIFGLFGLPAMGVKGAAIATVISRFAELLILVIYAHTHRDSYKFLKGAFRSFKVPTSLATRIIVKGLPIMLNEILWASAMTARSGCYATRGLDVVAGLNIASTVCNLFNVVYMALGSSIAIVIGNLLGAGEIERAKDESRKMMAFSVTCSVGMSVLLACISPLFPLIYNTTSEVRRVATYVILINAAITPFMAFAHSAYFTIRSGGKVLVTLLSDSVFVWCVTFPIALVLSSFTQMNIYLLYPLCQSAEIIKMGFGLILLKKTDWAKQVVGNGDF